jgi:hypothetical protein
LPPIWLPGWSIPGLVLVDAGFGFRPSASIAKIGGALLGSDVRTILFPRVTCGKEVQFPLSQPHHYYYYGAIRRDDQGLGAHPLRPSSPSQPMVLPHRIRAVKVRCCRLTRRVASASGLFFSLQHSPPFALRLCNQTDYSVCEHTMRKSGLSSETTYRSQTRPASLLGPRTKRFSPALQMNDKYSETLYIQADRSIGLRNSGPFANRTKAVAVERTSHGCFCILLSHFGRLVGCFGPTGHSVP